MMLFPFPHSVFARRVFHYCALSSASFSVKTQGDSTKVQSFNDFFLFRHIIRNGSDWWIGNRPGWSLKHGIFILS